MEAAIARRRVTTIAGHFVADEDVPASHQHILPVNCSGSLNSTTRRWDNRMLFARQASSAQACFMRRASATDQDISSAQPAAGIKCFGSKSSCHAYRGPLFSRPKRMDPNVPRMGLVQPLAQGSSLTLPVPPPQFARPNQRISGSCRPKGLTSEQKVPPPVKKGKWSPRMDVGESVQGYILTVEIPGVSAKDIRVEVNDRNLIVVGKRSIQSWKVAGFSSDLLSSYHRREIQRGPYQVVWPLPNGVNKDNVLAEFADGLLQVIVPKL
ncbi:uncharacterized protein LOC116202280 isoform X2 [Punica granatum]|uniref:Uncharacterized protein LOC116202280 isoform X2 n=2 Tax=Punica granatum TaxID=22663 RepID=A0A218WKJ8_PUNGR|nr:uncharacterized protein LOC116202280 isoform X2 [Punica granatum]OWM73325.1 hypothetical protein CDL15_Pgr001439 [Punica granatum]